MVQENKTRQLSSLKIDPDLRQVQDNKKRAIWIVGITGVIIIIIILFSFSYRSRAVSVKTATAQKYNTGQGLTVLNASGYVTPRQRATVAAKITGQVIEIPVEEGIHVEAGQVLARLDDADARVRLAAAKADFDVATSRINELEVTLAENNRDLIRAQELFEQKVTSKENLDKAQFAVDRTMSQLSRMRQEIQAAQARVHMAQQDLDNCIIRAPFAGIVVSKDAQIGEMVSPISAGGGFTRTGIATIVDMDSLEIEVDVNEALIANIAAGQKVVATLDSYPDWNMTAYVRTLIPTADRQKATVKVRIAFEELDTRILPDMGIRVAFKSRESVAGSDIPGVVVPKAAVMEDNDKRFVFVLNGDTVEKRAVTAGKTLGGSVEVLAGISAGEKVVIEGLETLNDGQQVVAN